MSTLLSPPVRLQSAASSVQCSHLCGRSVQVNRDSIEAVCEPCRRADIVAEAHRAIADVKRLVAGEEPFELLTQDERAEFLASILYPSMFSSTAPTPLTYPGFRKLADETLLQIVTHPVLTSAHDDFATMVQEAKAELVRRIAAPSDVERDAIEAQIRQEAAAGWLE